ncbi:hypothetical protein MN186_15025 [Aliiroseovarius sp. N1F302]|nr:hypothetical protein [Aliiroseovarius sediminis]MCI2395754.1 hypothetical protein [Aliiroseovarius sediminis]
MPELNASVIFGGYTALFQFMNFLQDRGWKTGVFVLTPVGNVAALLKTFESNNLVHKVLSASEISDMNATKTMSMSPKDMMVSYNWTTSIAAATLSRHLDDPAYYYFVQEDERCFYPNDSHRFLAESVFLNETKPRLICNSAKLLDHFRAEGLVSNETVVGVFEQGLPAPAPLNREAMAKRSPRRFVFYGRPEDHAKRNLMSIAMMAIAKAKKNGAFDAEPWEFCMMGSSRMGKSFDLEGVRVNCLPYQGYDAYRETLAGFDVGLSLMYAPHPSVPPFEMVRSGMITVVNTTPRRPDEWYRSISENFEPGAPSVDGLADAIARATARVGDIDARLAATETYHPSSWEESFAGLPAKLGHAIFNKTGAE